MHIEHRITLMLKGETCLHHLDHVAQALQVVPGVRFVDLQQLPGHVIVEMDIGSAKPDHLVAAVQTVKGANWFCDADVM